MNQYIIQMDQFSLSAVPFLYLIPPVYSPHVGSEYLSEPVVSILSTPTHMIKRKCANFHGYSLFNAAPSDDRDDARTKIQSGARRPSSSDLHRNGAA